MIRLIVGSALALVLIAAASVAQDAGSYSIPIPERTERATVEDEAGRLQWKPWDELSREERQALRCPTCEGRKEQECPFCVRIEHLETCPECEHPPADKKKMTVCRTCHGEGIVPDPLEKAPCPGCSGAGLTRCFRCFGEGSFPAGEGTDLRVKCPVCKGDGHFGCGVCDGERFVEPPKLKPSMGEASAKDLAKAMKALAAVEEKYAALASTGDARKDSKLWAPALKAGVRYFPPLKKLTKDSTTVTKTLAKGVQAVAYAQMVNQCMDSRKASLEYYLKHQRRMLELCLARQEHNDKIDDRE